jgi:hypothetical protein
MLEPFVTDGAIQLILTADFPAVSVIFDGEAGGKATVTVTGALGALSELALSATTRKA